MILSFLIFTALLAPCVALDIVPVPNGVRGEAKTTRYFDACKSSCAWPDKSNFASLLQSVTKSGAIADKYAPSGCVSTDPNAAFADPRQQPIVIDDTLSLGYAAVGKLNGQHGERELCCTCMELTFTSGPVVGKKMIVQITNTGGDLGSNHFDLMCFGGGQGLFTEGVKRQYGNNYYWGAQYGGVQSIEECRGLPAVLHAGCRWRFDFFENADNPDVTFRQVECPRQLTDISKCIRADAGSSGKTPPVAGVPQVRINPMPAPAPAPKPVPSRSGCSVPRWGQCSGSKYKGEKCCKPQDTCKYINSFYSQCIPSTKQQQQKCSNKTWSQCGGKGFKGKTCCPAGTKCVEIGEYYFQCR